MKIKEQIFNVICFAILIMICWPPGCEGGYLK